jgi:hypothetical protein
MLKNRYLNKDSEVLGEKKMVVYAIFYIFAPVYKHK